jgi:hypothetical protein
MQEVIGPGPRSDSWWDDIPIILQGALDISCGLIAPGRSVQTYRDHRSVAMPNASSMGRHLPVSKVGFAKSVWESICGGADECHLIDLIEGATTKNGR